MGGACPTAQLLPTVPNLYLERVLCCVVLQIRPCEMYKEEYSDCTSVKARFHQYFIHGRAVDCAQWNRDYSNCCRWRDSGDAKAAVIIT